MILSVQIVRSLRAEARHKIGPPYKSLKKFSVPGTFNTHQKPKPSFGCFRRRAFIVCQFRFLTGCVDPLFKYPGPLYFFFSAVVFLPGFGRVFPVVPRQILPRFVFLSPFPMIVPPFNSCFFIKAQGILAQNCFCNFRNKNSFLQGGKISRTRLTCQILGKLIFRSPLRPL